MNRILKIAITVALALCSIGVANAQFATIRANALLLPTGTINVGMSFNLNSKMSFDIALAGNPIPAPNLSFRFAALQPGVRMWLREIEYGHFICPHMTVAYYNTNNKTKRYVGWTVGAGISYGYSWPIMKRMSISAEIGASLLFARDESKHDDYDHTQDYIITTTNRFVIAPTKFEVSCVYLF